MYFKEVSEIIISIDSCIMLTNERQFFLYDTTHLRWGPKKHIFDRTIGFRGMVEGAGKIKSSRERKGELLKANSKIRNKVGNWHVSPPQRRETAVTGPSFLAVATTSG